MYWYVWPCIAMYLVCIFFLVATRVFGRTDTYWNVFWYVLQCIGMYCNAFQWYVLQCIGMYCNELQYNGRYLCVSAREWTAHVGIPGALHSTQCLMHHKRSKRQGLMMPVVSDSRPPVDAGPGKSVAVVVHREMNNAALPSR